MITPEEFPYITSIYVNDCYAYQNFNIDLVKHQPFSHLILTGKNGSGKSTILRMVNNDIVSNLSGKAIVDKNRLLSIQISEIHSRNYSSGELEEKKNKGIQFD